MVAGILTTIILLSAAELTSGILCICFPEMGALLPKTRRKLTKFSGHRRPTRSELQACREPISSLGKSKKISHDPYMTDSLTDRAFGTNEVDGRYIELNDTGHTVHIGTSRIDGQLEFPKNGVVVMNTEFKVERQEVV